MGSDISEKMRQLPSIDSFVKSAAGSEVADEFGAGITKFALRGVLKDIRTGIRKNSDFDIPGSDEIAQILRKNLVRLVKTEGRRAVNATNNAAHRFGACAVRG